MRPPSSEADRLTRRSLFGEVAEDYAAVRPGYPGVVADWIGERVPLGAATRILEIGCGAGQATRLLGGRGCRITALEPHPALAAIARRGLDALAVRIVEAAFEDFVGEPGSFDLVLAAASFHWLDPATRCRDSARLLRPGGGLAIVYSDHPAPYTGFFSRVQSVYQAVAPALLRPASAAPDGNPFLRELEECGDFDRIETRSVDWSRDYGRDDYLRLLNTYSDHRRLDGGIRRELFEAIGRLIDADFGGHVVRPYRTMLHLALRRD